MTRRSSKTTRKVWAFLVLSFGLTSVADDGLACSAVVHDLTTRARQARAATPIAEPLF